jgi:hypothetical protein
MTDVAGILARYGIPIDCEKDREYMLDLVRRLSDPWLRPGFKPVVMDEAASVLMSLLVCPKEGAWARNQAHVQEQSSHAKSLVGSPDAGPEGRCAPREESDNGREALKLPGTAPASQEGQPFFVPGAI